ncbi:hypothetical protein A2348_01365 [Candidatus Uhrbacteria bacterium RIFOXYB12_FULL_58_10]|uniref:Uncharacterized protein n=1 Tax=Candidatus Uhrbacteria bacterium RIFOXYB2_FULL_57_15 TaxID=1802422 RepID=A0A1F7W5H1_9BACT|nr:MAG: hypothetical protein A2348_01365 [Candidatus Uhrbacteria bacterium RIFOXYB12_FULL_58_10]OGL98031.1 MAG: hypothetical protein A2304_00795 [Candidatus Uhrbacteria bacterium RIFOXYB2_FULL_57_15]OGL99297.1 MAG: hypothetical protein A2501_03995 [Candidatus Uhrbacteria bacterium RIFOXYC12_FULL_57_11]
MDDKTIYAYNQMAQKKVTLPRLFSYYQKDEVEGILNDLDFDVVYFEQFKPGKHNYLNFVAQNRIRHPTFIAQ